MSRAPVVYDVLGLGASCLPYHAGLSMEKRRLAHRKFVNDQVEVVVATVAFGMGIDKPDVRKVIHYGGRRDSPSYSFCNSMSLRETFLHRCVDDLFFCVACLWITRTFDT